MLPVRCPLLHTHTQIHDLSHCYARYHSAFPLWSWEPKYLLAASRYLCAYVCFLVNDAVMVDICSLIMQLYYTVIIMMIGLWLNMPCDFYIRDHVITGLRYITLTFIHLEDTPWSILMSCSRTRWWMIHLFLGFEPTIFQVPNLIFPITMIWTFRIWFY